MSSSVLLTAFALILIIEGLGPCFFPNRWREFMLKIAKETPIVIRQIGISLILSGLVLLYFVL